MRKSLSVAVMAAATLLAGGATAAASESPSPSASSSPTTADSPESATPLERVSAYTQPSVVYLEQEWTGYVWDKYNKLYLNDGNPFTLSYQCTGYVVHPDGYIATAGHCVNPNDVKADFLVSAADWAVNNGYYQTPGLTVEDALGFDDYVVQNEDKKNKPSLKVTAAWAQSAGGVETGKALPARVVKWQSFEKGDGAILKVEASNLNALPLTEAPIEIGNEVVAVGYPGSVDRVVDENWTPSYKEGSISSKKTIDNGLLTVYEISAATSGGMSGGPVVNLDGEVVGFVDFKPGDESQPFNFIRPASTIRELIGDAGTTNQLSEDGQAYRAGLDAYFAGDKEAAVENLSTVVDDQPTNEFAKTYLDKAKDLPDPVKEETTDEGGGNLGLIIGIVVGLLVLAAIAVGLLLMLSRGKKKKAGPVGGPVYGGPAATGGIYPQPGSPMAPAPPSPAVITPPTPTQTLPAPQASSAPATQAPPAPASPDVETPPQAEVDEDVFCSNCGTKGEPNQKFCKHCGTAL